MRGGAPLFGADPCFPSFEWQRRRISYGGRGMHIGVCGCDRHTINGKISAVLMWPLSSCTHPRIRSPDRRQDPNLRERSVERGGRVRPRHHPGPTGRRPDRPATDARPRVRSSLEGRGSTGDRGAISAALSDTFEPRTERSAEPRLDRKYNHAGASNKPPSRPAATRANQHGAQPTFIKHSGRLNPQAARGRQGF